MLAAGASPVLDDPAPQASRTLDELPLLARLRIEVWPQPLLAVLALHQTVWVPHPHSGHLFQGWAPLPARTDPPSSAVSHQATTALKPSRSIEAGRIQAVSRPITSLESGGGDLQGR